MFLQFATGILVIKTAEKHVILKHNFIFKKHVLNVLHVLNEIVTKHMLTGLIRATAYVCTPLGHVDHPKINLFPSGDALGKQTYAVALMGSQHVYSGLGDQGQTLLANTALTVESPARMSVV